MRPTFAAVLAAAAASMLPPNAATARGQCGQPGAGDCCVPNDTPGCDLPGCCDEVCQFDLFCCEVEWDVGCADIAAELCAPCNPAFDGGACCLSAVECVDGLTADQCTIIFGEYQGPDTLCAAVQCPVNAACGNANAGDCCTPNGTPGCELDQCCATVCGLGFFECCEIAWDDQCVAIALMVCQDCFPTGACCFEATGVCENGFTELDCTSDGGVFQGVGLMCDEVDCAPPGCGPDAGPCCLPNGTPGCDDAECCALVCAVDPFCCALDWDGVCVIQAFDQCKAICGPPIGACCLPGGGCDIVDEETCIFGIGGGWQGIGSACEPSPCPPGCGDPDTGDCCTPNSTPYCDDAGCCAEVCAADLFCCSVEWDAACANLAIQVCDEACGAILTGACCLPDGSCIEVVVDDCTTAGGAFQGPGSACADVRCAPAPGACCLPDGDCFETLPDACSASDGVFQGFAIPCDAVICPPVPGACCLPDGACLETLPDQCTDADGAFQGFATLCAKIECTPRPGACCLPDGVCQELSDIDCAALFGDFNGFGSRCDDAPACPVLLGACCFDDGACTETTADDCDAATGVFLGFGTDCASSACQALPGACCFGGGVCDDLFIEQCVGAGGVFQGFGSDCTNVNCTDPPPQQGACCFPSGDCLPTTSGLCLAAGGSFQGVDVMCAEAAWAPSPDLDADGAVGSPDLNVVLGGFGCTGPDCPGDLDADGDTDSADLNLLLGAFGRACPPAGACCLFGGQICVDVEADACDALGGEFAGDGAACDAGACP